MLLERISVAWEFLVVEEGFCTATSVNSTFRKINFFRVVNCGVGVLRGGSIVVVDAGVGVIASAFGESGGVFFGRGEGILGQSSALRHRYAPRLGWL